MTNDFLRTLILATTLAAGGCATCAQHPTVCTVGAAVIMGSVAASVDAHGHRELHTPGRATIGTPNCAATPALCQ